MRKYLLLVSIVVSLIIASTAILASNQIQYFLPQKITFKSLSKPTQKQIECLAENIFFEAANEPEKGKVAVAFVTLNRLYSGNYAKDICGVVHQKVNGTCQFSWVCEKTFTDKRLTIRRTELYNDIRELAVSVFMNYEKLTDFTKGATYYHADYVNPGWKLPKTVKIGAHIFYVNYIDLKSIRSNKA